MHGQGEGPGAIVIGIPERFAVSRFVPEHRQGVLRRGIVDHVGDALFRQVGDDAVTLLGVLRQQRVLRPHGQAALRHKGRGEFPGKGGVVAPRHGLPGGGLVVRQGFQLGQQNRRLQIVQTGVHAHADIVVLTAGAFAVDAEGADEVVDLIIIRKHRAAVAIASKRLGREEGGGGDASEGACLFP